jgi:hypothetical protein
MQALIEQRDGLREPACPAVQIPLLGQGPEFSGGGLEFLLGQAARLRRARDGIGGQGAGAGQMKNKGSAANLSFFLTTCPAQ